MDVLRVKGCLSLLIASLVLESLLMKTQVKQNCLRLKDSSMSSNIQDFLAQNWVVL